MYIYMYIYIYIERERTDGRAQLSNLGRGRDNGPVLEDFQLAHVHLAKQRKA